MASRTSRSSSAARNAFERVAVRFENLARLRVPEVDDAANLHVNLDRGVFGIVAVLRDFAAQENRLFLPAET